MLPVTAKFNQNNHLEIGGCDVVELAKEFGTPLFIVDEETVRAQCRSYKDAFFSRSPNVEIIYASKAFISLAICQIISQEGLSIDVSSGGELFVAFSSGFEKKKIYLHGNNKSPDELSYALDNDIGRIVVDSHNEIDLLEKLLKEKNKKADILLRITPGIKPSTHTYVQTGQIDSKFGFGLSDGTAEKAVEQILSINSINLCGFHIHIGSQIFVLHSYAKSIEIIMDFVRKVKDKFGYEANELNVGGGLGIKYEKTDEPSTIDEYAEVIVEGIKKEAEKLKLKLPKIMIEPGRSIIGNAGVTAYTIGTIKQIPGIRTYISVDGGMSDNLRPMLYDAAYEAIIANKVNDPLVDKVTVAGKHCESGDVLIKDVFLPSLEIGDILVTPATGAYGYSMANNYNKQPRPAVVLVKDGMAKVIIRRETYEDLVRLDYSLHE
ncbi:MAG: diaminopimelate decarboxylase [Actinobacteria bacterium]|nr:diaminopimelate decarboxylase [Actinomycetota bacterium]